MLPGLLYTLARNKQNKQSTIQLCTTDEGSCIAAKMFGLIFLLIGEENYKVKQQYSCKAFLSEKLISH